MRSFIYAVGIMRQRSVERPPARLSYEAMVRTVAPATPAQLLLLKSPCPYRVTSLTTVDWEKNKCLHSSKRRDGPFGR